MILCHGITLIEKKVLRNLWELLLSHVYFGHIFYAKKMFNQDEGKIECAVRNREIRFWEGKKAEIVLILFLSSGFAVLICLWFLVLTNSNN